MREGERKQSFYIVSWFHMLKSQPFELWKMFSTTLETKFGASM